MSDWQKNKKPEYCKWSRAEIKGLIGKKLKIWHEGGVYPTLNTSDNYKWPSINMKIKGGESGWNNYTPKAGDSGVVVHFFTNRGSPYKYIIVLYIKGNYVPVGCNYLAETNKQYIRVNGFTTEVADTTKMSYEFLYDDGMSKTAIATKRKNTLHPKAFCRSEHNNEWHIGFLSTKVNLDKLTPEQKNQNLPGKGGDYSERSPAIRMAHKK